MGKLIRCLFLYEHLVRNMNSLATRGSIIIQDFDEVPEFVLVLLEVYGSLFIPRFPCLQEFFSCEHSSGFAVFCCALARRVAFHVFPGSIKILL